MVETFIVRISDQKVPINVPAENIKVRTTDTESAANMSVDIHEEITGDEIGEPALMTTEKFIDTFATNRGYVLEVIKC